MKRYILNALEAWKNSPQRKPLIIQGARQVGKTWVMKEFGKQAYAKVAYVNFADMPDLAQTFEGNYNLDSIFLALSIQTKVKITPGDTLIILDEIQECERALNALKFFHENAPQYHIMVAGSLLGVAVRQKQMSFPVGQVDFLNMYPLSFCEFLEAMHETALVDLIFHPQETVIKTFQDKYIHLLKQYMYVGGMPEVVKHYVQNKDVLAVRKIQNAIITGYADDFQKYTEPAMVPRIKAVWNSVPSQLAKENRKFTFGHIQAGARAREYETALEWLDICGLVYKINRITKPDLPLQGYADTGAFKVYMLDIGLLGALSHLDMATIINGTQIFEEFKGALTEQYVLQEMKLYEDIPIFYWSPDAGKAELDFVIQLQNWVVPIEVKATVNLRAKSLASYRKRFNPPKAVRTSLAEYEVNTGLYNIPLYMIENLKMLLQEREGESGISLDF